MACEIPNADTLRALLGDALYRVWTSLCAAIDEQYDMDRLWDTGYREWVYEYKYRRGGKTLCTLCLKEQALGLLIIFGRAEREKLEAGRAAYPEHILRAYDDSPVLHDGKWVMFYPSDAAQTADYVRLLGVKRRPNRK